MGLFAKQAMEGSAGKVRLTIDGAIILALRLVQLDAVPLSIGKRCRPDEPDDALLGPHLDVRADPDAHGPERPPSPRDKMIENGRIFKADKGVKCQTQGTVSYFVVRDSTRSTKIRFHTGDQRNLSRNNKLYYNEYTQCIRLLTSLGSVDKK